MISNPIYGKIHNGNQTTNQMKVPQKYGWFFLYWKIRSFEMDEFTGGTPMTKRTPPCSIKVKPPTSFVHGRVLVDWRDGRRLYAMVYHFFCFVQVLKDWIYRKFHDSIHKFNQNLETHWKPIKIH